jgi:putative alpha-1,2-mannosidase
MGINLITDVLYMTQVKTATVLLFLKQYWYVFSALGFYPVCPGSGQYVVGTPYFDEVELLWPNGRRLHLISKNNSMKNRYIGAVTFNGEPYTRNYVDHEALIQGGTLCFDMQATPQMQRGIAPEDAPYSFSNER